MVEYTKFITGAAPLPSSVEVGERVYDVLGYYQQASGKKVTKHKDKVALRNRANEKIIITNWPMSVYKTLTHYKEIK
jgi:hypothetical protein